MELAPKLAVEKGPLFLNPADVPAASQKTENAEPSNNQTKESPAASSEDPAVREIPRTLVKGPSQSQPANVRTADQKNSLAPDDADKGVMDDIKQDIEGIGKVMNPLRW